MTQRKLSKLTIICELIQWSLDNERGHVTGIIANTTKPRDFQNEQKFTLMNCTISAYPAGPDGPAYYLARSQMGNYFKLFASERI
jgi:hypothetical protein